MINIRDLHHNYKDYDGKVVTIGGWVRSIRDSKTFGFMVVNDGTFFEPVQVVYAEKLDNFETICKLNVGAAVIVICVSVKATPEMKQPFEIHADEVVIEGESTPDYPLQKKRHSFEYLRTICSFTSDEPILSRQCSVCSSLISLCDPHVLPWRETLSMCTHHSDHRQ